MYSCRKRVRSRSAAYARWPDFPHQFSARPIGELADPFESFTSHLGEAWALSPGKDATLKSVLIIDDDIEFCDMLRDYLSMHDIRLSAVHDGAIGLTEIRSTSYDVVLLDVMLPDIDGYEVLRRIRKFSSIGVLMLSTVGGKTTRLWVSTKVPMIICPSRSMRASSSQG